MKCISEIVTDFFVKQALTHVFMSPAGATDVWLKACTEQPQLEVVLTQPVEVSLMAAAAYASVAERPAVVCLAPGARVFSVLSGLYSAWREGKPLLVLSTETDFQAAIGDALAPHHDRLKYSANLSDPQTVLYELQTALQLACSGRPGPVWVNIAPALCSLAVDENTLRPYETTPHVQPVVSVLDEFTGLARQTHEVPSWQSTEAVDPHCFSHVLSDHLAEDQIIVNTQALPTLTATAGQRLLSARSHQADGYELPAAIGACFGSGRKKIVCVTTRAGLQRHGFALATVRHYQLPIKLFVLSPLAEAGSLFAPDFEKIADAYELQYVRAESHDELNNSLAYALSTRRPTLCEIVLGVVEVGCQSPMAEAG